MAHRAMQKSGHNCCPREMAKHMSEPEHRECCQMDQERTPPVPRENGTPERSVGTGSRVSLVVAEAFPTESCLKSGRLEAGAIYTRPVFEAKADLRI